MVKTSQSCISLDWKHKGCLGPQNFITPKTHSFGLLLIVFRLLTSRYFFLKRIALGVTCIAKNDVPSIVGKEMGETANYYSLCTLLYKNYFQEIKTSIDHQQQITKILRYAYLNELIRCDVPYCFLKGHLQ